MAQRGEDRSVPAAVERFVQQLVITYKSVVLYPPASAIPSGNAEKAALLLDDARAEVGDVEIAASKQGLSVSGAPVLSSQSAARTLGLELYHRSVAAVRFRAGADAEALLGFLGVMRLAPEEIEAGGGFAACLWDAGVDTITVAESSTMVVEAEPETPAEDETAWPPDHARISHLLATARRPSADGYRVLVRVLVDREAVCSYVASVYDRASASGADDEPGAVIAAIARVINSLAEDEKTAALNAIAEATRALPQGQLRARTAERLLVSARTDRAVAALVRQVGLDAMCRALTEGVSISDESVEGLARAIRNLAQISAVSRDEVANAAGAALRAAGAAERTVTSTLGAALPVRIASQSGTAQSDTGAVDEVLRLVDLAAAGPEARADDPALRALIDEAHTGFTDSDVIGALVTLAVLGIGTPEFEPSLQRVEDNLGVLLERGEFEVAAETADMLLGVLPQASPRERERILEAIGRLSARREMRALHRALHVYDRDSSEYLACRRLLETLGGLAIEPLLEMLADEPDMALRKSMVEVISSVADRHVEEVGRHVNDGRWYFVRNVVSILGATKRSESVPFLGKTLRHADARVRRESIRALAGIPDRRAAELLVNALEDPDAGNVQLAARYLGSLARAEAVPALIEVARGEGVGSREFGPRSEAVEALGQIGSAEALPALEELAARRPLVGGGRARDLATVAAAAIAAINGRRGEQGR